jgi:hypothetical protein
MVDMHLVISGVPGGGSNSEVLPELSRMPTVLWNIHLQQIRIWVSFICKLSEIPDYGATAPRSPFSLPSILN